MISEVIADLIAHRNRNLTSLMIRGGREQPCTETASA
jgi:hypothetical protein